ncbi:FAD dependent oxidoreductase superfamily [Pochonia chlamydosporia 170]|uniref:FAD dependent oxidoreductase superfamily n=1 Tax=Pochonia chlamydosporia 170 TaxID=1380566 RepID=A0A179FSN1_METCM|nr:FAD dependent oxidoreductase superfamily [Pochonia chlamydosporia 170]OAQ68646.1 FAD dependent oxidoreductase superfamily [Pochonia chlamydosporia 170]
MSSKPHVVIIGAGVIGLTSALELSQSHNVTVLATHLPGDWAIEYSSPRAGAHFRPTPVNNEKDALENTYMHQTFDKLKHVSESDTSSGVEFIPAVEYFESDLSAKDMEMFSSWPGFRILKPSELPKSSIKAGLTYDAWVLNSPVYLKWLQRKAEDNGVVFVRETLTAIPEAVFVATRYREDLAPPEIVVNASGIGFGDAACFPSRGQFILIENTYQRTVSHHCADGHATVVIPRPLGGGTVIGGTKEPNNWSPHNSTAATEEILRRVAAICPDILQQAPGNNAKPEIHVKEAYVGRRPMRKGGMRLESEIIEIVETAQDGLHNGKRNLHVVHCYGAGPSGYKISWGVATKISALVRGV